MSTGGGRRYRACLTGVTVSEQAETRAYKVTDPMGERSMIVHAKSRGAARSVGASKWGCVFTEVRVVRAPEFDDHVPSAKDLVIEHGWWWSCHECGEPVDSDDICAGASFDEEGRLWCSQCWRQAEWTSGPR